MTDAKRAREWRGQAGRAVLGVALGLAACAPHADRGQDGASTPGGIPTDDSAGAPHPLILVSMDGYRWDYVDRPEAENVAALAAEGVRAEALVPPFPSKTFPGHYSIVTGLYPGHHGIISNNMRDPRWPEEFGLSNRAEVENGRWWQGEPVWIGAQHQGLISAVYFWPGSEAAIQGVRPTHWRTFDGNVPFDARVDQALDWLELPVAERPSFIGLYFGEPNNTSHRYGPEADETWRALARVDRVIGRLLDGLAERGLRQTTNIVLVSDHGMALNDRRRVIVLDEFVELLAGELFEQGALVQIFPRAGREDLIYEALAGAHPSLHVYRRAEIPDELHLFDHPRLPPILATPDPGWEALSSWAIERSQGEVVVGDHGQDPRHPDMQGLFVAAGPAFARGVRVPAIEAVDIYQLLAAALGIPPAPHDGDMARVRGILREPGQAAER